MSTLHVAFANFKQAFSLTNTDFYPEFNLYKITHDVGDNIPSILNNNLIYN